ncbi:CENP-B protein [Choiromyces venosus 120613-1]|uniref:CENP-B protein n=1 Tax=Choiromyces venosus 120613-1 TaxID=1336337 RepID=A0A3N4JUU9_9PEZI|nr:CENP-B protein [Choiromyces venosus 120613-1]
MVGKSSNGWTSSALALGWLEQNFGDESQSARKAKDKWRMLTLDGHLTYLSWDFLLWGIEHHIIIFCPPPHTTSILQPIDVGLFGPLKHYYTSLLQEQRESGIQKADFYSLFIQAWTLAFTTSNIQKAFSASGIWPLD